jgi:GR25 family glycosyltransferase involved in LPS biosynthesis
METPAHRRGFSFSARRLALLGKAIHAAYSAPMHSLIIHMQGDQARAPNVERLLSQLPDAQVLDAVRGADHLGQPTPRPGDAHTPTYPFALTPGEIGCFLSHRKAWQHVLDAGHDYALIVEDDAAIDPRRWSEVVHLLSRHALTDAYIRLPAKSRETGAVVDREGDLRLILPRRIGLQTVAQIVGRGAAARLLGASETIDRPVDTFLQMHWITGQKVHSVLPCPVRELTVELGGSTIQKKTASQGKLLREVKRAIYRTRIAMRPQRV